MAILNIGEMESYVKQKPDKKGKSQKFLIAVIFHLRHIKKKLHKDGTVIA